MSQINNKFTAYWIDTTTAPGTPILGLSATITIREATSPYTVVVNSQPMTEVGGGWYIYEFSSYDSTKDYLYDCNPGSSLAFKESGVTSQSIWNDDILTNSNIIGSFGEKFSQYGGVSHVIDRSSFDDASKKELEDIRKSFKEASNEIKNTIANIKPPQVISEGKTTVVKYNDKQQEFIQEFITETIPELADKIDNLIPLLSTYEELIKEFEDKESYYENLIEELINNK